MSGEFDRESVDVRNDGTTFNVRLRGTVFDYRGKPHLLADIRDITERKRAEEELRELEALESSILEAIPHAVIGFHERRIYFANRGVEAVFGWKPEELIGKTSRNLYRSEEEFEQIGKDFYPVLQRKKTYSKEFPCRRKDGKDIMCLVSAARIGKRLEEKKIVGVFSDITDHKRAEAEKNTLQAQLQQAQKMEAIGTLAGGIAHDFNNLLMAIQGNASLMLFDIDANHPHYGNVKKIEKQVGRGSNLTRQLLGYARKGRYEVKPVGLNNLVEETSETFGRTRKEITIHRELAEDLFAIEADEGQIEHVMLNLYVNASDAMSTCADGAAAMPGGGNLILKTMNVTHEDMGQKVYDVKPGKYVLLTVTDTGEGMDKETRERIFEPFFTTKEMGRGTGLGLASAYGIVKAHGGYIDVDSEKGRGATFSVYLPASEKEIQEPVKAAGQIIEGSGTILFVDDETMVLEASVELVKSLGYNVVEAQGGKEAVEIYKANKDEIDLVILDMVMPHMGGGEAYDRMKEMDPNVKVLLSSGYSIDGWAKEILERGCDGFIQKPFGMRVLSQRIKETLTLQKSRMP